MYKNSQSPAIGVAGLFIFSNQDIPISMGAVKCPTPKVRRNIISLKM